MSNKLIQKKYEIDVISTESYNINYDKIQNSDILGIAYPTYSSNAPPLIYNVISKLKKVDQKKAFAITTMGYISGDTNWHVTKKLKEYHNFSGNPTTFHWLGNPLNERQDSPKAKNILIG